MNYNVKKVKIFVTVPKEKLEVICAVGNVKNVIQELRKKHPYEEPAIDIVPLMDESDFDD